MKEQRSQKQTDPREETKHRKQRNKIREKEEQPTKMMQKHKESHHKQGGVESVHKRTGDTGT